MPLTSEDYGFKRSEIAPGEVELRWQPESWGAASWAALGIAVLGVSFPVTCHGLFPPSVTRVRPNERTDEDEEGTTDRGTDYRYPSGA